MQTKGSFAPTNVKPKWSRADWRFVVLWMLFVPWAQSSSAGGANAWVGNAIDEPFFYAKLIFAEAFVGACIGFAQWAVLRAWAFKNPLWIVATSFGWAIAVIVEIITMPLLAVLSTLFILLSQVVFIASSEVIASIPQWFVLRHAVSRSALWILINAAAWIGMSLVMVYSYEPTTNSFFPFVAWTTIGIGLFWLLRHPKSQTSPQPGIIC